MVLSDWFAVSCRSTKGSNYKEGLTPVLSLLTEGSRCHREIRRYIKTQVMLQTNQNTGNTRLQHLTRIICNIAKLLHIVGTSSTEGCEEQARGGHHCQKQAGPPHDTRGHGREADSSRVPVCSLQRERWVSNTRRNPTARRSTRETVAVTLTAGFTEISISLNVWRLLSVDNLLKYTGYGNAAGLLVARGLLAGGRGETQYSDDEDSDTDEYKSAKPLWVTQYASNGLF